MVPPHLADFLPVRGGGYRYTADWRVDTAGEPHEVTLVHRSSIVFGHGYGSKHMKSHGIPFCSQQHICDIWDSWMCIPQKAAHKNEAQQKTSHENLLVTSHCNFDPFWKTSTFSIGLVDGIVLRGAQGPQPSQSCLESFRRGNTSFWGLAFSCIFPHCFFAAGNRWGKPSSARPGRITPWRIWKVRRRRLKAFLGHSQPDQIHCWWKPWEIDGFFVRRLIQLQLGFFISHLRNWGEIMGSILGQERFETFWHWENYTEIWDHRVHRAIFLYVLLWKVNIP